MPAAQHRQTLQTLNQRASREERREQLIKVAAYIVEFEGIDALKHARIAELAGCGRPLVYSYFPQKSDLYFAISESFYRRLEERFTCEEQYQAIKGFLAGDHSLSTRLEGLIWDVIDEDGCAGLILRTVPEPMSFPPVCCSTTVRQSPKTLPWPIGAVSWTGRPRSSARYRRWGRWFKTTFNVFKNTFIQTDLTRS